MSTTKTMFVCVSINWMVVVLSILYDRGKFCEIGASFTNRGKFEFRGSFWQLGASYNLS